MLKTKIKASSITNLTDARYFAAREVEWLGFPVGNGISMLEAKAIAEWVDGVRIVCELEFPQAEELQSVEEQWHPDAIQVGMFTPLPVLAALPGTRFIKEVVVVESMSFGELAAHFHAYSPFCEIFLLNFSKSGLTWDDLLAGRPFAIGELKGLLERFDTLLELGLPADQADQLLEFLRPLGLSLTGGSEEKTGFKSFDELDEVLDALETNA